MGLNEVLDGSYDVLHDPNEQTVPTECLSARPLSSSLKAQVNAHTHGQ